MHVIINLAGKLSHRTQSIKDKLKIKAYKIREEKNHNKNDIDIPISYGAGEIDLIELTDKQCNFSSATKITTAKSNED